MRIEIKGKPMGKQRPRFYNGVVYTSQKTVNYESLVRYTFQKEFPNHKPFEGYIEASITAVFEVPKSYSKKKTKELLEGQNNYDHKPDLDNIAKIVLDSLNGIAYRDDSQITILHLNKEYGEQAKVILDIEEVSNS